MGEQGKGTNRIWFIHGGALFVFLGLAMLFLLLGGGTGEKQPVVVENSASIKVDELPDVVTDEVADDRLEAYNQAAMIIRQEEKEKELQEEHNSFHFFAEEVSKEDEAEVLCDDLDSEEELQKIRNIMNGNEEVSESEKPSSRAVAKLKKPNSSQVMLSQTSRQQTKPISEEDEIDLDKLKAREKKDKLKRLKALYYGEDENEEEVENSEEVVKEEPKIAATPPPANGFKPMNESYKKANRGSVRAVIHGEQKNITSSSQVVLRILDPVEIEGTVIPRNTTIIGMASFNSNRVYINIENIAYANNVYPFKGTIYDQDGFRGIYFPNNLVNDAKTEAGSETLTSTNVNVSGLTGIVNTGANALINATKNVVNGSVRETKVTLPANYKLIIKTSGS